MANRIKQYPNFSKQDATFQANIALPNAANTVNTNAIDLKADTVFPSDDSFVVNLALTSSTGANSKNINCSYQHTAANADGTADNGNWVNIPELAVQTVAGNTTNVPAANFNVMLPPTTKRFIRGSATGEVNGGNSSNGTITISLLF